MFLKAHPQSLHTHLLCTHSPSTLHQAGADVAKRGDLYRRIREGLHLPQANTQSILAMTVHCLKCKHATWFYTVLVLILKTVWIVIGEFPSDHIVMLATPY